MDDNCGEWVESSSVFKCFFVLVRIRREKNAKSHCFFTSHGMKVNGAIIVMIITDSIENQL